MSVAHAHKPVPAARPDAGAPKAPDGIDIGTYSAALLRQMVDNGAVQFEFSMFGSYRWPLESEMADVRLVVAIRESEVVGFIHLQHYAEQNELAIVLIRTHLHHRSQPGRTVGIARAMIPVACDVIAASGLRAGCSYFTTDGKRHIEHHVRAAMRARRLRCDYSSG